MYAVVRDRRRHRRWSVRDRLFLLKNFLETFLPVLLVDGLDELRTADSLHGSTLRAVTFSSQALHFYFMPLVLTFGDTL